MNASTQPVPNHGFMVLHGNRLEDLRDVLLDFIASHPLPVLEPELILLQSNGMKHWLERALAADSAVGICAATRMLLPSSCLWQMYRLILGPEVVPQRMPFDKTALLWRLLRLLPRLCVENPVYATLERYFAGSNQARKLYQLAQQLADVFDGYQNYRADWLSDWALGQDQLRTPAGLAPALPAEQLWQAQLWRDLRADMGPQWMDASRAQVQQRFLAAVEQLATSQQRPPQLPQRLIVFGVCALPMQMVQALAALGRLCQVLLLVQNPCQYFWGDLAPDHADLRAQMRRRQASKPAGRNHDQPTAGNAEVQPLLAAWGKQGRDYLHLLDGFDQPDSYRAHWRRVDIFVDPAPAANACQLAQLQSAIFNLQAPPAQPLALADDGSLVFVSSHSAQREVEVLHDQLLAWLDDDPELQPHEVMVMVPDIETFVPHIEAVFGRFTAQQARFIPYSVADSTQRHSPLTQVLEQLLHLPQSRLTLSDWLDMFEVAAVRRRFGIDEAGLHQLQQWLASAGVRWGLDEKHRLAWGWPADNADLAQNTWAFGLRRLLLGYALGNTTRLDASDHDSRNSGNLDPDALWCHTLAQPALGGLDAPLAGALLNWLQAVEQTLKDLQGRHRPQPWQQILTALVQRFFSPGSAAEADAIASLLQPLEVWLQNCADGAFDSELELEIVREHWLAQLGDSSLQQRFFGAGVQFGSLMPMRSIPFKVICLLGMNDGDYPRAQTPPDFDLISAQWRLGDRSRREDDRYLFLEALLSARQKFYLSWQGRSACDNAERAPSVLVAQLQDVINRHWAPARQVQATPLQAFSKLYFAADSNYQTFNTDWEQARALPVEAGCMQATTAQQAAPTNLTLADLQMLLRQPVEVFLRRRLQIELESLQDATAEDEPFALDALQQYRIGADLLATKHLEQTWPCLRASGSLPPASFGQQLGAELLAKARCVLQARASWLQQYPVLRAPQAMALQWAPANAPSPLSPIHLTGQPAGLLAQQAHPNSACLQLLMQPRPVLQGTENNPGPRHHLLAQLWPSHLAASACGLNLTSVLLGIDGQVLLPALAPDQARNILQDLLQMWQQAWAQPLPVACKTALAYLLARRAQHSANQAGKESKDPQQSAREAFALELEQSNYVQRAFTSYDQLAAELPQWAEKLYGQLLAQAKANRHPSP